MKGHIILFEHFGLRGAHKHVFNEESNLARPEDKFFNDRVSSFIVMKGTWKLYRHINFDGAYDREFPPGIYRWVKDFDVENDDISSLRCISS